MTVTATLSTGPKLDKKIEKGVHIIKVPPKASLAETLGNHASEAELLSEAAKHVGKPAKTDIVVFDHKPWHVLNGQLRPHPQVHTEDKKTILELSFEAQDRAVWWSEQPFRITRVNRSPHHLVVAGSPDYPFDPPQPPYDAKPEQDDQLRTIFVVRSTPIVKPSIGQMYKISFFMDEDIDPDMSCTP